MNIPKAIEILTLNLPTDQWNRDPKQFEALRLGIEALKRTSRRRENLSWKFEPLLPGETEE